MAVLVAGVFGEPLWSDLWKTQSTEEKVLLCHALLQGMTMAGPVLGPSGEGSLPNSTAKEMLDASFKFYDKYVSNGFWKIMISFMDTQMDLHPEYDFSEAFYKAFAIVRKTY